MLLLRELSWFECVQFCCSCDAFLFRCISFALSFVCGACSWLLHLLALACNLSCPARLVATAAIALHHQTFVFAFAGLVHEPLMLAIRTRFERPYWSEWPDHECSEPKQLRQYILCTHSSYTHMCLLLCVYQMSTSSPTQPRRRATRTKRLRRRLL